MRFAVHSDSFPRQSTEVFILQMMLKNFLFYGFSNFINTWAGEAGPGEVFKVFGIVSLALLALCIPMCKYSAALCLSLSVSCAKNKK